MEGRAKDLQLLCTSIIITCKAISDLSLNRYFYYSELLMLSRSVFEKIINYLYLSVNEEEIINNYRMHAVYTHFHKKNYWMVKDWGVDENGEKKDKREIKNVVTKIKKSKMFQEALKIYPENKNDIKWTNIEIEERIKYIGSKNNHFHVEGFLVLSQLFYKEASEIIHGTPYGIMHTSFTSNPYVLGNESGKDIVIEYLKGTGFIIYNITFFLSELCSFMDPNDKHGFVKMIQRNMEEASSLNKDLAGN